MNRFDVWNTKLKHNTDFSALIRLGEHVTKQERKENVPKNTSI
jgi:hypothetical protein